MRRLCVASAIALVFVLAGPSGNPLAQSSSLVPVHSIVDDGSAARGGAAQSEHRDGNGAGQAARIGPAVAARIVEHRQKNGGFKKIEELMNVKGIGEKTFLKLKSLVTVTPPKTEGR